LHSAEVSWRAEHVRLPTTQRLAIELDALKPVIGAQACRSDDGSAIIAFFRYGRERKSDDPVTVGLSGCAFVTNGHVNREAGAKLLGQLEALMRSP
jgi:hypothetical protein